MFNLLTQCFKVVTIKLFCDSENVSKVLPMYHGTIPMNYKQLNARF